MKELCDWNKCGVQSTALATTVKCPEVMREPRKIRLMGKWIPAEEILAYFPVAREQTGWENCWLSDWLVWRKKSGVPAAGSNGGGVVQHCQGRVSALLRDQSPWLSFLCSAQNHSLIFDHCVQGISCKSTGIWLSSKTFTLLQQGRKATKETSWL